MCFDPITLLTIGSTVLSTGGALVTGQQEKANAEMQARAYDQQAASEAQAASFEVQRERYRQDLATSAAIAATGASGVGIAGSPTEAIAANARQGQLDMDAIRYGSQLKQNGLRTQADIARFSGQQAVGASVIKAGGNLVSGLSNLYDPAKAVKMGTGAFARSPRAATAIMAGGGGLY